MTSGGQCVMTTGTTLMLLWSASSWDMRMLEVRMLILVHCVVIAMKYTYTALVTYVLGNTMI